MAARDRAGPGSPGLLQADPERLAGAAKDLDRQLPANGRALVLPGELFSFYTGAAPSTRSCPRSSKRPVAERTEVPYSDLRAADLLWTIDGLVHQGRLLPGQLSPLLRLIGVRSVITGTDSDLARSDAPAPADVAQTLATQPEFVGRPGRTARFARSRRPESRGPGSCSRRSVATTSRPPGGSFMSSPAKPRSSSTARPMRSPGWRRSAASPATGRVRYAADLAPGALRGALGSGGEVVITDSNRRRAFVAGSLEQNVGATLPADQTVSADGIILDPFGRGPDFETVATYTGIRSVSAPFSPQTPQSPEHRPFAALDGSPATAWLADPTLDPGRRYLDVAFTRPTDVPYVDLLPTGPVAAVSVGGRSFAVHPGWNHLVLGARSVGALRVALTGVRGPAAGGIRELRIPGVHATEQLRVPVDAAEALRGADLDRVGSTYLFERTTGDHPFRRSGTAGDGEPAIRRVFQLPAARTFTASAWVGTFPPTPRARGAAEPSGSASMGERSPCESSPRRRAAARPGRCRVVGRPPCRPERICSSPNRVRTPSTRSPCARPLRPGSPLRRRARPARWSVPAPSAEAPMTASACR